MKKRLLLPAVLTAVLSFSAMQPFAYAEAVSAAGLIEPYYDDNVYADVKLTIQNKTATCYSSIEADEVVKITAEQTLQKQGLFWSWSKYDNTSWTKTANASYISMSNTKSGLKAAHTTLKRFSR